MDNKEETFDFKDPEQQMEKQVEENIEEHIAPEAKKEEPVKVEEKPSFFQKFKKPELPKQFIKQPKHVGAPIGKKEKIKRFFTECLRVLRVTKKPDKQEFYTIVKVSALGMAIMGVIGFVISLLKEIFL